MDDVMEVRSRRLGLQRENSNAYVKIFVNIWQLSVPLKALLDYCKSANSAKAAAVSPPPR